MVAAEFTKNEGVLNIGVLAVQGSVVEHVNMLKKIDGVKPIEVKIPEQLYHIDGLILPGGESTAIGKLIEDYGLNNIIVERAKKGMPIWGTCAGMILMAKKITGQNKTYLNLMDIVVKRNAYGSQLDSFATHEVIPAVSDKPLKMVFIRAPYVEDIADTVEILAKVDGHIVAVKQDNLIATSFHPELTDDTSFHRYFIKIVRESIN
ncbi:5'-phosphate synthase pdxT subunit [Caldanaerobius fijiensis DSM 17918]|uniref:Pyridoxal 5'-phosphate synthase subunit PdxT n=1 Tax=Caldanaerobius fijiensis DSM 17918 TaxID=1121256 RepID=A0A1M5AYV0_9THEO|nr:pyridoxal 5'-phosphate synthase glutaminase subunit PdxT [Caldanaerobius fijiensis]SHF35373.1 5'-phosphate synthase pdxT subunit [Caldanaerobius fijiensis DSM 17918]